MFLGMSLSCSPQFLLEEDASTLINAAEASDILRGVDAEETGQRLEQARRSGCTNRSQKHARNFN